MSPLDATGAPLLIGISACLLGERVRYDGGHKRDQSVVDDLGPLVQWVPLCPEVEAGFGIPRPPMQLEGEGVEVRLVGVADRRDRTERMVRCAQDLVAGLSATGIAGFVLKSRSPSCGPGDAPLFDATYPTKMNTSLGVRDGVFAHALRAALPGLPLVSEEALVSATGREAFLTAAAAYQATHNGP